MSAPMTVERLSEVSGYPVATIRNALFAIAKLGRKRGVLINEEQAIRGLGEVLAFASVLDTKHRRPPVEETPTDPPSEPGSP